MEKFVKAISENYNQFQFTGIIVAIFCVILTLSEYDMQVIILIILTLII